MSNINNEASTAYQTGSAYNSLTAFFDSRSEAEAAVERLKAAGITAGNIRVVPGQGLDSTTQTSPEDKGFWAKLEDFFYGDDDREVYAEGLRRGGYLVTVSSISGTQYDTAHGILDEEGSIDLDERSEQWRSEGWTAGGATGGSAAPSYDRNQASAASREDTFDAGTSETISVVEENLRVGKRDINSGSVRVRSYVREEAVSEDLTLRDENVEIERRTVDRPLRDADLAFQDRTISAEEHHEEAVVSKDARVVEEIGIRKTATEREETINDTVRKTEVEVDDERRPQPGPGQNQNQGFRRDD